MITIHEVRAGLRTEFPNADYDATSNTFDFPNLSWVKDKHYPWFKNFLYDYSRVTVWNEKFQCNNFSNAFCCLAHFSHTMSDIGEAEALAIGTFWYKVDGKSAHAIVIILQKNDDMPMGFECKFLEPQTGKLIKLSKIEKLSAYEIRI